MARVLVIDDHKSARDGLRVILEEAGHQVQEASDGKAGLRLLDQHPADLVFCDIFMPGEEGLETIQRIRRGHPSVKIGAMSGGFKGMLNVLHVAVMLGAFAALEKPFRSTDVLALAASVHDALPAG